MNAACIPTTPAADHHHVRGRHARHATEQDAAAAEWLLEDERSGLGGDLARNLGHRREQRQPAARVLDGLIGDARRPRLDQPLGQGGFRGQVEVREQRVARLEALDLLPAVAPSP